MRDQHTLAMASPGTAVQVGDATVDSRDVAGITRGTGRDALLLTVHTFPVKKVGAAWPTRIPAAAAPPAAARAATDPFMSYRACLYTPRGCRANGRY